MIQTGVGAAISRLSMSIKHRIVGRAISRLDSSEKLSAPEIEPINPETDEQVLARAEAIIGRAIDLGRKGRLKAVPEAIAVGATENCNLECIMCPGHAGMKGPMISVDEAEMLFASMAIEGAHFGSPKILDMTSGEPTLNPELGTIYGRFKELFPDAKISMISNGTIPVRGRIKEAFEHADRVGLSMDGATQETYERIRQGSVWKNVVRNVKEVAEIKRLGENCETLQIMMVVMDQNIHELPEMVRFAHSVGIPQVFAQAAEVRGAPFNIKGLNVSLDMSKENLAPIIREAKDEAERLGVDLSLTSHLEDALRDDVPQPVSPVIPNRAKEAHKLSVAIKTCNVPWVHAPRISKNRQGIYPTVVCCHMPQVHGAGNLTHHPEFIDKPINDIFNSDFYWGIRAGLLDGSLAEDACRGCQYHQMTQWTAAQLRELEQASDAAESA
ncbi:radical SAM protein [Paraburkholderia sp. SOS3]|uniref:radical SAM protein n=1 Tax=Paraburkholderia sp. SOS3 TaxID=1926494 RepID=UPI0018DEA994|nr:radical SAM protein [Paraburkholderia sp. SOS3]